MTSPLRIALVHDYLREYGGAERVLESLHELFPDAPLYTSFVDKDALGIHWQRFADWEIHESIAAKIPFIKKIYSPLRLLSAFFFETFDLSSYDVVISSTNMYMAKAVLTRADAIHICYCHTPPRSLYGYTTMTNWKKNPLMRVVGELINFKMRQIDFLTAQRPTVFVANSNEVAARIQKFYRRDSVVIYPPVSVGQVTTTPTKKTESYFLYVNRLAFAKHPELAVQAATKLGVSLKVVGMGSMFEQLKETAGPTVEMLGAVDDQKLRSLYAGAMALLYPVEDEDFGIVPVESMMLGVPVIAHRSGGPKETIIDGKTGVFFDELTVDSLVEAIKKFQKLTFKESVLKDQAAKFSTDVFHKKILALVKKLTTS